MKRSILAARTEQAIHRIEAETARLGGEFAVPHVRGNVEHQQLALLEALALALEKIGGSTVPATAEPAETDRPSQEPAEAISGPVARPNPARKTRNKGV